MFQQMFSLVKWSVFSLSAEWSKSSDFAQLKCKDKSQSKKTVKIKETDGHTVTLPRMWAERTPFSSHPVSNCVDFNLNYCNRGWGGGADCPITGVQMQLPPMLLLRPWLRHLTSNCSQRAVPSMAAAPIGVWTGEWEARIKRLWGAI